MQLHVQLAPSFVHTPFLPPSFQGRLAQHSGIVINAFPILHLPSLFIHDVATTPRNVAAACLNQLLQQSSMLPKFPCDNDKSTSLPSFYYPFFILSGSIATAESARSRTYNLSLLIFRQFPIQQMHAPLKTPCPEARKLTLWGSSRLNASFCRFV